MGYTTTFDVYLTGPASDLAELTEYYLPQAWKDLDVDYHDSSYFWVQAKWYEWEEDFVVLSLIWPTIEFQIEGQGEDNLDIWKALVFNGQSQRVDAEITFPEFEPWKNYVPHP